MVDLKEKPDTLTDKEFIVLQLLAKGCTDREISASVNMRKAKVSAFKKYLCRKFDTRNCTQLVYRATKLNML